MQASCSAGRRDRAGRDAWLASLGCICPPLLPVDFKKLPSSVWVLALQHPSHRAGPMAANGLLGKKAKKKKKSTHLSGPSLDHTDAIFPREDTRQLYLYLLIPPITSSAQLSSTHYCLCSFFIISPSIQKQQGIFQEIWPKQKEKQDFCFFFKGQ